ncbi:MAG: hypothetical protein FWC85_03645, partial [Elusimicrobia bacterium]|nr:hypothetical protein [Elusimicrobiota bacterium]
WRTCVTAPRLKGIMFCNCSVPEVRLIAGVTTGMTAAADTFCDRVVTVKITATKLATSFLKNSFLVKILPILKV